MQFSRWGFWKFGIGLLYFWLAFVPFCTFFSSIHAAVGVCICNTAIVLRPEKVGSVKTTKYNLLVIRYGSVSQAYKKTSNSYNVNIHFL